MFFVKQCNYFCLLTIIAFIVPMFNFLNSKQQFPVCDYQLLSEKKFITRSTGGASAEAPEDTVRRGAKHRRCKCIRRRMREISIKYYKTVIISFLSLRFL
jgi:hypothetical protein